MPVTPAGAILKGSRQVRYTAERGGSAAGDLGDAVFLLSSTATYTLTFECHRPGDQA